MQKPIVSRPFPTRFFIVSNFGVQTAPTEIDARAGEVKTKAMNETTLITGGSGEMTSKRLPFNGLPVNTRSDMRGTYPHGQGPCNLFGQCFNGILRLGGPFLK